MGHIVRVFKPVGEDGAGGGCLLRVNDEVVPLSKDDALKLARDLATAATLTVTADFSKYEISVVQEPRTMDRQPILVFGPNLRFCQEWAAEHGYQGNGEGFGEWRYIRSSSALRGYRGNRYVVLSVGERFADSTFGGFYRPTQEVIAVAELQNLGSSVCRATATTDSGLVVKCIGAEGHTVQHWVSRPGHAQLDRWSGFAGTIVG